MGYRTCEAGVTDSSHEINKCLILYTFISHQIGSFRIFKFTAFIKVDISTEHDKYKDDK